MSLKASFPNPLDEATLAAFCHPIPSHALAKPLRIGGEILAGNGYLCLRAHRGRWLDSDFPEAAPEQQARLETLKWGVIERLAPAHWQPLAMRKPLLFKFAPFHLWAYDQHDQPTGKCHPCPIWKCGDAHPVRLSILQLISRLPNAQVWTGPQAARQPLYFRCTGARGIVAADNRLDEYSFSIFQPSTDRLDGSLVYASADPARESKPRLPAPLLPGQRPWPPPEPCDD